VGCTARGERGADSSWTISGCPGQWLGTALETCLVLEMCPRDARPRDTPLGTGGLHLRADSSQQEGTVWGQSVALVFESLQVSADAPQTCQAHGCSRAAAPARHHPAGLGERLANVGLLMSSGSGAAGPGAGARWGPEGRLRMERMRSKAPRWGGEGREMRQGTRICAGSTGFSRLSHRAGRAEEPRLILSLPRCLRRDYRVGLVDGCLTPWQRPGSPLCR